MLDRELTEILSACVPKGPVPLQIVGVNYWMGTPFYLFRHIRTHLVFSLTAIAEFRVLAEDVAES